MLRRSQRRHQLANSLHRRPVAMARRVPAEASRRERATHLPDLSQAHRHAQLVTLQLGVQHGGVEGPLYDPNKALAGQKCLA